MKKSVYTEQRKRLTALLRKMRVEAGLSQTKLAELIDREQTVVSRIENDNRRLDILEIREICLALGITFEEFARRLEKALK
ncbi:MAG TPA: helix-turn-helix transcriptional regulator [Pyrinomonadaceae bacterium]|nr:helix-turn-helix transcriptional regulator [Pyrinomonadaceae bacterium]